MNKKILYLDMDGVIADFDGRMKELFPELYTLPEFDDYEKRSDKIDEIVSQNPRLFETLTPMDGAIKAVKELFSLYDVYFLSTPMWAVPESFMGKRIWLEKHFGDDAKKRLILTHRKDLAIGNILVDDRLKNGAGEFKGKHIHFGKNEYPTWKETLRELRHVVNPRLRQLKSLINEKGRDDFGASGMTFEVDQLIKDKVYEEADRSKYDAHGRNKKPFFVDDNGCSRDIQFMLDKGYIEEIFED
jgi:5'-nucleotidase